MGLPEIQYRCPNCAVTYSVQKERTSHACWFCKHPLMYRDSPLPGLKNEQPMFSAPPPADGPNWRFDSYG